MTGLSPPLETQTLALIDLSQLRPPEGALVVGEDNADMLFLHVQEER